jgi:hypothetical protein
MKFCYSLHSDSMVMIREKLSFTLISQTIGLLGVSDKNKMWKLSVGVGDFACWHNIVGSWRHPLKHWLTNTFVVTLNLFQIEPPTVRLNFHAFLNMNEKKSCDNVLWLIQKREIESHWTVASWLELYHDVIGICCNSEYKFKYLSKHLVYNFISKENMRVNDDLHCFLDIYYIHPMINWVSTCLSVCVPEDDFVHSLAESPTG